MRLSKIDHGCEAKFITCTEQTSQGFGWSTDQSRTFQLVRRYEQRICAEYKKVEGSGSSGKKSETCLGVTETQRVWSEDVPIVMEYKRRLGLILQALAMLKTLKETTYTENTSSPSYAKRVNRAIATVDGHHQSPCDSGKQHNQVVLCT
jgi:hypothetical protein